MTALDIPGFLAQPKLNAKGMTYQGRFTCPNVQWINSIPNKFVTFTITAGEIADACSNNLLWTDQDVQRGIQPSLMPQPEKELSLSNGFPDASKYIFDVEKANEIAEKLLIGDENLFLSSLIWNLRPGKLEAFWNEREQEIYIYNGRIYLPDSHHRHQAIIKAVGLWRESPKEYKNFSDEMQFKVELHFLSREDEGNYFYAKNQLPKPTAKSKAYDLTTQDDLSILAKSVIVEAESLRENVNRVTDRLDNKNPQVMTLSTLREMMRTFTSADAVDSSEMEGLAKVAAEFYDLLAAMRPELSRLKISERRLVRERLLVDAAVMMHGYAALMRDYNFDLAKLGRHEARRKWDLKLRRLSASNVFSFDSWSGELFDKRNPLWASVGVVRIGGDNVKITVMNTGAARGEAGRNLRQLLALESIPNDLSFLTRR